MSDEIESKLSPETEKLLRDCLSDDPLIYQPAQEILARELSKPLRLPRITEQDTRVFSSEELNNESN